MPETLDLQPVAEELDFQPAGDLDLQPAPDPDPSPDELRAQARHARGETFFAGPEVDESGQPVPEKPLIAFDKEKFGMGVLAGPVVGPLLSRVPGVGPVLKGVGRTIGGLAEAMLTPSGAAALPATILAPAVVLPELIKGGIDQSLELIQEGRKTGDISKIAEGGSLLGITIAPLAHPVSKALNARSPSEPSPLPRSSAALDRLKAGSELTEFLEGVETAPLDRANPLDSARAEARPSRSALSTPEALRRTEELQLATSPEGAARPEMAGPETLGPLIDPGYRREIVLRADEIAERVKAAFARRAELEAGGKLEPSGLEPAFSTFSRGAETRAARSAEERITAESRSREPDIVRDPVITESTPLKAVEQLVRERLEQRDWEAAVTVLAQTPTALSRKLVDKLLGTQREAVPLSVGERTIFNETWDATVERLLQPELEAAFGAELNNPSGVNPLQHLKRLDAIVQRLESLRTPLEPGVGANPFPNIARAVWNTGLDIAIGIIKAGGKLEAALSAALAHIRKNAQGFDEAAVRSKLESVIRAETQAREGAAAASRVSDSPLRTARASQPPPLSDESALATPSPARRPLGDLYSEPLVERLARFGGPVSRTVTRENLGIIDSAKRHLGELNATAVDPAKQAVGKAFRGGSTWLHELREVTPNAAVGRLHDVLETRARTGTWDHVPEPFRPVSESLWSANLATGRLAEQAHPAFTATGRAQRLLTSYGYDIVKRGEGPAWDAWSTALSTANNTPLPRTQAFLRRWKRELDTPGADATHLDRIAQDFERHFPNVITHIRPTRGLGWHEIIQSSPFDYLTQTAQRTSNAVAFREVYPLVEHEGKWVPSGKLEATRTAVQRELNTSAHATEFDNTMKALQGHPLDSFTSAWTAPDTIPGMTMRAADTALKPLRSLMLSSSFPVNIGESLSGGAHIFLGYGRAFKAMTHPERVAQMKRSGMLNAAIRDFSFDKSQPLRSLSRQTANVISRTFMSDFMNEFQEFTGASAARIVADEIRSGTLPPGEIQNVTAVMRAMGIDRDSAIAAVQGNNPKAVQIFETKASEFFSSGNQLTAEKSRLGASRAFNSLFWFHSYPMTKVRQARSLLNNLIEDFQNRDFKQGRANATLLGRFMGGTALGGAISLGVMRLLYDGLFGSEIQMQEAQDDFAGFVGETLVQGMGGPIAIAARIFERGGDLGAVGSTLMGSIAPVGIATELTNMALERGQYEGLTEFERIGRFLLSKTPASRALKQGMAALGLSQDNVELDAALKAFYTWRRSEMGSVERKSFLEPEHDRKEFRSAMRRAVEALKDGKIEEFDAQIDKAFSDPEVTTKSIKASLRGRTILKSPTGKPLSPEENDQLRAHIGQKAVNLLEEFDAMLKAQAR